MPSRRQFAALVSAAAVAGCAVRSRERDRSAKLGTVWLVNDHDRPVEVTVVVRHQATTVLERTYELAAGTERKLPEEDAAEIPSDGRDATIRASRAGEDHWDEQSLARRFDRDCLSVVVQVFGTDHVVVRHVGCGETPH
jgi:hypothetical protein